MCQLPAPSSLQHRSNFILWQTSKAGHVSQERREQSGLRSATRNSQGRAGDSLAQGMPQPWTLHSVQKQSGDVQIFHLHLAQSTVPHPERGSDS